MDVRHVALLANLTLTPAQKKKFSSQFADTLETISVINQLDTENVSATAQVTGLVNVTREDKVDLSRVLTQTQVISASRHSYQGFIVVPAVFDE